MRKFLKFITAIILAIAPANICSCTQNDGDIGDLYGLWTLRGFSSDGEWIPEDKCDGHSVKFQSDIVQYMENLPYHNTIIHTGTWHISSDSLILKFPVQQGDDDKSAGGKAPAEMDFPIMPVLGFKINTLSGSVLDISRTTSEGITLRYYFKKLN